MNQPKKETVYIEVKKLFPFFPHVILFIKNLLKKYCVDITINNKNLLNNDMKILREKPHIQRFQFIHSFTNNFFKKCNGFLKESKHSSREGLPEYI